MPNLSTQNFGYMFLAANDDFADVFRASQATPVAAGAAKRLMKPEQIMGAYPFNNMDDVEPRNRFL